MAEQGDVPPETVQEGAAGDDDDLETPGYKAPKKVDLETIQKLDADDESLVKYKEQLLGKTEGVLDEGGQNVILKTLIFAPDGRDEMKLDLTGDLTKFKTNPIVIKEGTKYKLKIEFRVQREIVAGLKYVQRVYRKGIKVETNQWMVGSYGPKTECCVYTTPEEDTPSGMMSRGHYTVKSQFIDDDKHSYLDWEWAFDIKKEWAE